MQPLWQIEGQILVWIQNNLRQENSADTDYAYPYDVW